MPIPTIRQVCSVILMCIPLNRLFRRKIRKPQSSVALVPRRFRSAAVRAICRSRLYVLVADERKANLMPSLTPSSALAAVHGPSSQTPHRADTEVFAMAGGSALAIYNTGNNTPGRIAEMSAEYFENSWRVCCFGGFLFGRAAINGLQAMAAPYFYRSQCLPARAGNFGAFNSGCATQLGSGHGQRIQERWRACRPCGCNGPIGGEKSRKAYPSMRPNSAMKA